MTERRDVDELLDFAAKDRTVNSFGDIAAAADRLVRRVIESDPDKLRTWLWDNASVLVANQLISRSVQSLVDGSDVHGRVRLAIAEWYELPDDRPPLVRWLRAERPLLLRAWFNASSDGRLRAALSLLASSAAAVVDAQLAAYNAHDIDTFVATYAEDAEVVTTGTVVRGRDAVRAMYAPLFANGVCHAEVVARVALDDAVIDLGVASGMASARIHALVAYRMDQGLIASAQTIAMAAE